MRRSLFPTIVVILSIVAVGFQVNTRVVSAQGLLDRIKKAAKDAQKPQQPAPPATAKQPPQQQAPPSRQPAASSDAPTGDCCSPDAIKKFASTSGFLDIGGIKLGMTPEQVVAAVKAFNPNLKVDVVNQRMEPPDAPGTFVRVPQVMLARIAPSPANGSDRIGIEFSIPPSPPVVIKIVRELVFPAGQPVVASTLIDGLRKKYGQETTANPMLTWVFDVAGKPITRPLTGEAGGCVPVAGTDNGADGLPSGEPGHDLGIELSLSTSRPEDTPQRTAACRSYSFATASPLGEATAPNMQIAKVLVTVQSGALLYGSRKANHDWLQAKADAKSQQQENAAKARSAPKF